MLIKREINSSNLIILEKVLILTSTLKRRMIKFIWVIFVLLKWCFMAQFSICETCDDTCRGSFVSSNQWGLNSRWHTFWLLPHLPKIFTSHKLSYIQAFYTEKVTIYLFNHLENHACISINHKSHTKTTRRSKTSKTCSQLKITIKVTTSLTTRKHTDILKRKKKESTWTRKKSRRYLLYTSSSVSRSLLLVDDDSSTSAFSEPILLDLNFWICLFKIDICSCLKTRLWCNYIVSRWIT